jgi:antitoxin VapB
MTTAKIFHSKNCRGVPLPKQIRVHGSQRARFRRGEEVLLRRKQDTMLRAFQLLQRLPCDPTTAGRQNDRPQERNAIRLKKRGRG